MLPRVLSGLTSQHATCPLRPFPTMPGELPPPPQPLQAPWLCRMGDLILTSSTHCTPPQPRQPHPFSPLLYFLYYFFPDLLEESSGVRCADRTHTGPWGLPCLLIYLPSLLPWPLSPNPPLPTICMTWTFSLQPTLPPLSLQAAPEQPHSKASQHHFPGAVARHPHCPLTYSQDLECGE